MPRAVELYRRMLLIRLCEEQLARSHQRGLVLGACHTYVGQEAIAVGVCAHLRSDDVVFSTHRGHGHALAKGMPPRDLIAELFGRSTGCSRGRGGSMHLFAPEVGMMGTSGIVGPCILQAAGAGYSFRILKCDRVAVAFFGDGAVNNGAFHEGVNLASIWKLPVLFVCENNQFATEVPFDTVAGNPDVAKRGEVYGLPGISVNGNDVEEVSRVAGEAVRRARAGDGPTLLECKTYRTRAHAEGMGDFTYRTREQVEEWKTRCPLKLLRQRLLERGEAIAADLEAIDAEVAALIAEAARAAEGDPWPDPATAASHVYAPVGQAFQPDAPVGQAFQPDAPSKSQAGKPDAPVGQAFQPDAPSKSQAFQPDAPVGQAFQPDAPSKSQAGKPDAPVGQAFQPDAPSKSQAGKPDAPSKSQAGKPDLQQPSRELSYMQATLETLSSEMARNPTIFVLGEGIGQRGGNFKTTAGLYERYGPERLRDTPICERGFVGLACGSAMTGTRPIVDFMFADFVLDSVGEILNQIAKMQYMSSGRLRMPILLRGCIGIGHAAATHHSGNYYPLYAHFPGLRVVVPSTPYDAKGLLRTALTCDDPVLFLEPRELLATRGHVPESDYAIPFGKAAIVREGKDITVVALAAMVRKALEVSERLSSRGISVEVIDPRTVSPLDGETILASVSKTGRLLIVDEAFSPFGLGAEVAARVIDEGFDDLDAPIRRLHGAFTPTPYSPPLEKAVVPSVEDIERAILSLLEE